MIHTIAPGLALLSLAPCPEIAPLWWQWHPSVGVFIGILGVLGVLAPWFRGAALGKKEKSIWAFITFALLLLELRTLDLDKKEHDRDQALARCQQLESFRQIGSGINAAIAQSQDQFKITIASLNKTLFNTMPRANLLFTAIAPLKASFPLQAQKPIEFNVNYANIGNETAVDVRHSVSVYLRRMDNSEDQNEIYTDFKRKWSSSAKPSGPVDPATKVFFTFASDPLSEVDLKSLLDRGTTIYGIIRLGWKDRTGRWLSDVCFGLQDPIHDLRTVHPCVVANSPRFPDRTSYAK